LIYAVVAYAYPNSLCSTLAPTVLGSLRRGVIWCSTPGPTRSPSSRLCTPPALPACRTAALGPGSPSYATTTTTTTSSSSSSHIRTPEPISPPIRSLSSCGGLLALARGQWIQKEVLLPIPASNQEKDDVTWPPTYSFRADMVFAVLTTSLCWVDLRTGILVCDHIDKLSTGTDDDDDHLLLFFISLPEECVMKPSLLSWKRLAEEHRTMICRDPETILFISMDNYIQGLPIGDTVLTTWTLKFPLTNHWTWEKHSAPSLFVGDLLNDLPVLKLKNPRMIGRRCTLPTARSVALTVKTILSLASLLPSMRGSMSKGIGESRDSVRDQH
jgi:hypothetical protein